MVLLTKTSSVPAVFSSRNPHYHTSQAITSQTASTAQSLVSATLPKQAKIIGEIAICKRCFNDFTRCLFKNETFGVGQGTSKSSDDSQTETRSAYLHYHQAYYPIDELGWVYNVILNQGKLMLEKKKELTCNSLKCRSTEIDFNEISFI